METSLSDRSELEALLGRVMVATVPSFELSNAILDVLGRSYDSGTHVTASVDAALALVGRCLPTYGSYQLTTHRGGDALCELQSDYSSAVFMGRDYATLQIIGRAKTAPLAILAALLRALLASHPAEPLKHMPA